MGGEWVFEHIDKEMSNEVLQKYQNKLIMIREKYEKDLIFLRGCNFHKKQSPPDHNVFALFQYDCKKHVKKCSGWSLLWNPNLGMGKEGNRLKSCMHNCCAPWEYQNVSKKIQSELAKEFPADFNFVDDYDFEFPLDYHNRYVFFKTVTTQPENESKTPIISSDDDSFDEVEIDPKRVKR